MHVLCVCCACVCGCAGPPPAPRPTPPSSPAAAQWKWTASTIAVVAVAVSLAVLLGALLVYRTCRNRGAEPKRYVNVHMKRMALEVRLSMRLDLCSQQTSWCGCCSNYPALLCPRVASFLLPRHSLQLNELL